MVTALVSGSSGPETWPGTLRCVQEKDTLLSQYLSPTGCINGHQWA